MATVSSNVADPTVADNSASETTTVGPAADLAVSKSASANPVLLGQEFTYTLNISNQGPSYDRTITLIDTLPDGVSFVSSTPSQGTCSGTSAVTCIMGTIASGDVARVSIIVEANSTGDLTNAAVVIGSVSDPSTGDNTTTETTTVEPASDLVLTKTDSDDPVVLGNEFTYALSVTNRGPFTATGVILTDTIPAGVAFVSSTPSQGTCSGTSIVTCAIGTLGNGDIATVSIVVIPDSRGVLINTAGVTGDQGDPNTGDNAATETTSVHAPLPPTPVPSADLLVTKADSPDPVLLGGLLTYTLRVINKGPSTGTGVVLTDTLPGGVRFESASAGCGEAGGTVTCAIGIMSSGDSSTVGIVVIATSTADLTNVVSVTSSVTDPNTGDNTAAQKTTVSPAADLVLTKADSHDPASVGGDLTYTINIINRGPSEAPAVTLTDALPEGVGFVSASAGCVEASGSVTCTIGSLASGDGSTVSIVVSPTAVSTIANTATVTGGVTDPSPTDNTATETTTVSPAADLSLTKADSPDPVLLGQEFTYTLTVVNNGPSYDTAITLIDTLPDGVSFVSSTPSQGTCSGTSAVTCSIGTIAGGNAATVSIVVVANSTGNLTNTAVVIGSVSDTGDTATQTTTVIPAADLVLTKADSPDPVLLHGDRMYTFSVTNRGPSEATGVTLTDDLPDEVDFVSVSQGCVESTGTVTCTIGTIASGDAATVIIVVTPGSTGDLTNTATVTSTVVDPSTGDNAASQATRVNPAADLALTKADSPDPVLLGEEFAFALSVVNRGPLRGDRGDSHGHPAGRSALRIGLGGMHRIRGGHYLYHRDPDQRGRFYRQYRHRPHGRRRHHQHGRGYRERRRPQHGRQHGNGGDDGEPRRRPGGNQGRLSRPGVVGAATHLRHHRDQQRTLDRHSRVPR